MIIRVSEAHVRSGKVAEFLEALNDLVATFPEEYEGLISQEIQVDRADGRRVRYVSHWRDEAALIGYAGAEWETTAVTFPGETEFLDAPLHLTHLISYPLE